MKEEKRLEYIKKANIIHNNKYDYSKAYSKTCKDKVTVICPIHGEFQITWDSHVNKGAGCRKCCGLYTPTTKEWIEEMSKIHKGKYDYSKTVYKRANDKVTVICHEKDTLGKEHGEFQIRASNHRLGIGCPKCGCHYTYTNEEWLQMAKQVHGDKYDYSETHYRGKGKKVKIICHELDEFGQEHGVFEQDPSSHMSGCGCPKCNKGVSFSYDDFVKLAIKVHGNKYDYSKFVYVNAKTPGIIICPTHGEFSQTPDVHLRGNGCSKCKSSKLENILITTFEKNNISYRFQYRLDTEKIQYADFYIPSCNTIIECQGDQHYKPHDFSDNNDKSKAEEFFKTTCENDVLKYNYCVNNGINVIYFTIPKFHINKNLDIYNGFYSDKIVITDIEDLIEYINNTKTNNVSISIFDEFVKDFKKEISNNIVVYNNRIKYRRFNIYFQFIENNKQDDLNNIRRFNKKRNNTPIIVFENEYTNKPEIVLSEIKKIIGFNKLKEINYNNVIVTEITNETAIQFIQNNNILGLRNTTFYYGCFLENELISVVCFKRENNNTSNYEMNNLCFLNGYDEVLLYKKCIDLFCKTHSYSNIHVFQNKRWYYSDTDNIFIKLGFEKIHNYEPNSVTMKNSKAEECTIWNCGYYKYKLKK